ncbi:MAG: hypothetical protein IPL61_28240 [Myxococcales bacterium]|nr:hypothetical protein [Myxococcales bacterium]
MASPKPTAPSSPDDGLARVTRLSLLVSLVAFAALIVYGAWAAKAGPAQAALGAALLGLGAVAVGAIIGFLFGVPVNAVAVAQASTAATKEAAEPGGVEAAARPSRGANQLVQVAEWLTRIFIGATVTQLGEVRDQLQGLGQLASAQLLGSGRGEIVFTAAAVFGGVFGFFVGHLSTRLIINVLFDAVENGSRLPTAAKDEVLMQARTGERKLDAISPSVARALVEVDDQQLTSSDDLQAWGLARISLDRDEPAAGRGLAALERAVIARPGDRGAIESLVLGALYAPPPEGFTRAQRELTAYFARHPTPTRAEANLYAYRACADGQAYADAKARGDTGAMAVHRASALAAARQALELDASWGAFLARIASGAGGPDDDLVELAKDAPELGALLAAGRP